MITFSRKRSLLVFLLLLFLQTNAVTVTKEPLALNQELLEAVEAQDEPDINRIHSLLEQGAQVGFVDRRQKTPLYLACSLGRVEVARLLIPRASHETINQPDLHGMTALHWASALNMLEAVQGLIEGGARVNTASHRWSNTTALHLAAMNGQTKVVQTLLHHGALVEASNSHGQTPLWLACRYGHLETVAILLDRDADVHRVDKEGVSPFAIANREDDHRLIQYLSDRFPTAAGEACLYKLQQWPFSCLLKTRVQFGIQLTRMGINAPMAIGYS
jgi:ankyrin repeat protein